MASLKQQHYRRIMKEQKAKTTSTKQKIDHPLARYNNVGQLSCVLCSVQVKSELLWSTHLQSRKHKDTVASLKAKTNSSSSTDSSLDQSHNSMQEGVGNSSKDVQEFTQPSGPPLTGKRKVPSQQLEQEEVEPTPVTKKIKTDNSMSNDGNDNLRKTKKSKKKRKHSATPASTKSGLPANFFDSGVSKRFHPQGEERIYGDNSSSDSEEEIPMEEDKQNQKNSSAPSALPANFFGSVFDDKSSNKDDVDSKKSQGALPEGFFDDPKKDAKARKVEYKDSMTEEWDKFQKSIQKEDDVSEALLFEGDEETMEERELEEVNQQVSCFTKAEKLRQTQEDIFRKKAQRASQLSESLGAEEDNKSDSESSIDETEYDEFLNWRTKIS